MAARVARTSDANTKEARVAQMFDGKAKEEAMEEMTDGPWSAGKAAGAAVYSVTPFPQPVRRGPRSGAGSYHASPSFACLPSWLSAVRWPVNSLPEMQLFRWDSILPRSLFATLSTSSTAPSTTSWPTLRCSASPSLLGSLSLCTLGCPASHARGHAHHW